MALSARLLAPELPLEAERVFAPDIALIDADVVLHRVGFTTENDDFWVATHRADEMLDNILLATGVKQYQLWLSDSAANNFRYQIYPLYKANRTKPKPKHHEELKAYLIQEWDAQFAFGMEADDYLGILQDEEEQTTVICSVDKDLKQIPGLHFNFVKNEWANVTRRAALKDFYTQIIVGDVSDNIPGAHGKGPVAAAKALRDLDSLSEDELADEIGMLQVRRVFKDSLLKEWGEWDLSKEKAMIGQILLAGRLLKIKRSFKEPLWGSQLCSLMEEFSALYTLPTEVVSDPFTEPTTSTKKPAGCPLVGALMASTCPPTDEAASTSQ